MKCYSEDKAPLFINYNIYIYIYIYIYWSSFRWVKFEQSCVYLVNFFSAKEASDKCDSKCSDNEKCSKGGKCVCKDGFEKADDKCEKKKKQTANTEKEEDEAKTEEFDVDDVDDDFSVRDVMFYLVIILVVLATACYFLYSYYDKVK